MLYQKIKSSISENSEAILDLSLDTAEIVKAYNRDLNIDVKNVFQQEKIYLYKCLDTGYRFFYPFNIAGDGAFYEQLQRFDWYYMPWKWEHEQTFGLIKPEWKILEVGSGQGGFLKEVKKRLPGIQIIGLELNEQAVNQAQNEGIDLRGETVQAHAQKHAEEYDLVCSFQVVEHIADIRSFMLAQIQLLKKGGKLIVSVPNNAGFLGDSENILNMPPHHMGLWEEKSLKKMGEYFSLKHVATFFEPLQPYHRDYFEQVKKNKLQTFPRWVRGLSRLPLMDRVLFPKKYRAFTIQMVWEK